MAALLVGIVLPAHASSQTLDARRLGMGGVVTSDMGAAADANIAFRAVPRGRGYRSIGLPLGLIQLASNPPEFDTSDPDFNAFEIADLITNPPLTLSLGGPEPPSSDIHVYVAQDSLSLDLEELRRIVPESSLRNGGVTHLPGIGFGFRKAFVHVGPIVHVQNQFDLEEPLRAALRDATPFTARTRYGMADRGVAQGAMALQVGFAFRAFQGTEPSGDDDESIDDPRRGGATALYVGAGPKYLFGIAYGDVRGSGGATTADTLFGAADPLALDGAVRTRHAVLGGDGGSGHGFGADIGAVLYWRRFEFGIGINDVASEIDWKVTERLHAYDDVLDEFTTTPIAIDRAFTSRIPATTTVNVARRFAGATLAAGVVDGPLSTSLHLGAERWLGLIAVRAGTYRDSNKNWQLTGGGGARLGKIGVDLAVASHQRFIEERRAVEMAASLTLY